jgi:hypothetical protein
LRVFPIVTRNSGQRSAVSYQPEGTRVSFWLNADR